MLSEAKYKVKHGKGRPSDIAAVARVAKVSDPKVSDLKVFDCTGLKILTTKQMLQRLPMAHAQVKAGNTSENLLHKIRQITYFLYGVKEITKKVYNSILNSIKL